MVSPSEDQIVSEAVSPSSEDKIVIEADEVSTVETDHSLPVASLYRTALKAYKCDKMATECSIGYTDRLQLVALSKQVVHGPYNVEHDDDAGLFNFIGGDRRSAWQSLGSLSKDRSMAQFVTLIDRLCPSFRPILQEERRTVEQCSTSAPLSNGVSTTVHSAEEDGQRLQLQKRQIEEALNAQTFHQFRAYAEQQHPGVPQSQATLIEQLQEQHYQQYMAQVYEQQAATMVSPPPPPRETDDDDGDDSEKQSEAGDDIPSNPNMAVASMWTQKDVSEFKEQIGKEGAEGMIKVGHGETVTVRVPTHEDGTCLFWEFATDHYDLGFGVYFEWTIAESNTVTVHVSESSDEEEEEGTPANDVETGGGANVASGGDGRPRQDEIIPIYRRDCHEEVYAGSHVYPGRGVYLLKFDNSYSLWRTKQLYYRVYYSK